MQINHSKLFAGMLVSGIAFAGFHAQAKPARPGVIEMDQPDGSKVSVCLKGDERGHYVTTSDGYALIEGADGFLYFAKADGDALVSTGVKALDAPQRSASVNSMLASFDKTANLELLRNSFAQGLSRSPYSSQLRGPGLLNTKGFPGKGSPKALVILVEFQDQDFSCENAGDYYRRALNERGFSDNGHAGSVRDFFIQNSFGQFKPEFDVIGPVKVSQNVSYYGGNDSWGYDRNPGEMVKEACILADDVVDFSQYDNDGDGYVDNVYIYYAGKGEADGGAPTTIWPHQYTLYWCGLNPLPLDNVKIDSYGCSNELQGSTGEIDGINTFVHEFSHVMGLADLYQTDSGYGGTSFTPAEWSIMDTGSYNADGKIPVNYSSFERYALDWIVPRELTTADFELPILADTSIAYIIRNPENSNEYFLFENRQKVGNDATLPGHGMLVWHVDYVESIWKNNAVNNTPSHQYVDLVEADNRRTEKSRNGDAFPGVEKITSYDFETLPSLKMWDGTSTGFAFSNIAENDGLITFHCEAADTESVILADALLSPDDATDIQGTETSGGNWECTSASIEGFSFTFSPKAFITTETFKDEEGDDEDVSYFTIDGEATMTITAPEGYAMAALQLIIKDTAGETVYERISCDKEASIQYDVREINVVPYVPTSEITLTVPKSSTLEIGGISVGDKAEIELTPVATIGEINALQGSMPYEFTGNAVVFASAKDQIYVADESGCALLQAINIPFMGNYPYGTVIKYMQGDAGFLTRAPEGVAYPYEISFNTDVLGTQVPFAVEWNLYATPITSFAPYTYVMIPGATVVKEGDQYYASAKDTQVPFGNAFEATLPAVDKPYFFYGVILPAEDGSNELHYLRSEEASGVGTPAIGTESIYADNGRIVMPAGSRLFSLAGTAISSDATVQPGIYIVLTPSGKAVKLIVK